MAWERERAKAAHPAVHDQDNAIKRIQRMSQHAEDWEKFIQLAKTCEQTSRRILLLDIPFPRVPPGDLLDCYSPQRDLSLFKEATLPSKPSCFLLSTKTVSCHCSLRDVCAVSVSYLEADVAMKRKATREALLRSMCDARRQSVLRWCRWHPDKFAQKFGKLLDAAEHDEVHVRGEEEEEVHREVRAGQRRVERWRGERFEALTQLL
eukprot:768017-Hanusia_phi.AAC.2